MGFRPSAPSRHSSFRTTSSQKAWPGLTCLAGGKGVLPGGQRHLVVQAGKDSGILPVQRGLRRQKGDARLGLGRVCGTSWGDPACLPACLQPSPNPYPAILKGLDTDSCHLLRSQPSLTSPAEDVLGTEAVPTLLVTLRSQCCWCLSGCSIAGHHTPCLALRPTAPLPPQGTHAWPGGTRHSPHSAGAQG